jgi:integrase/recombinase XerC
MTEAIPVLRGVQGFLVFLSARNDSPNTLRAYNRDLLQLVRFVGHDTKTTEINRKIVRAYLVSLAGLKHSSSRRKLAAVRSFMNWLVQENYADSNPCDGIAGPRRRQELPDVPNEKDIKRLLEGRIPTACPERDRLILELLYGCGLRAAELAGVNLEDFQDPRTLLVRGKGRKERIVPYGRFAHKALAHWLGLRKKHLATLGMETPALFFSIGPVKSVQRLDVRSIHRTVKQIAKAKGLPPYHPHQLRHACATHMHDHGAPIQAIASMLGHVKLSTSQIYTRVSVGRMMQTFNNAHPHAVKG